MLKNQVLTIPRTYFHEVRDLLPQFNRCFQPVIGLDIGEAIFSQPLARKLYEDCFRFPDKAFYWRYEKEVRNPGSLEREAGREIGQTILEILAKKVGVRVSDNKVLEWTPKRASFKHEALWSRFGVDLNEELGKVGLKVTGTYYYPPGGYLEWHTNANKPSGWRMYYIRVLEEGKSWFHYVNPHTNQLVQVPDKDDHFHVFYLSDLGQVKAGTRPEFFWHNVASQTHRMSLGIQVSDKVMKLILGRLGIW